VDVTITGASVAVKGPRGQLSHTFPPSILFSIEDGVLTVNRASDNRIDRSLHGMARSIVSNMVTGVSTGFTKILEVNGVGYRAEMQGKNLVLHVGYSHPVVMEPPEGISYETEAKTRQIKVLGHDKQMVGQVAADIRKVRPPEPYQGKGIKYLDEKIRRKAGKAGKV
jgi:large subunit ribosomal protein L6